MHEVSICEGIIQLLEEQAVAQHYQQVNRLWLEVGVLAGVELEALRFSFEVVSQGTLAEGARLEILQPQGRGVCRDCTQSVPLKTRYDACPECGGHQLTLCAGDELRIKQLEVA